MHQIGEVAEAVGLSLRTIRYYEETGLVLPSGRSAGGFRLYTDSDIDRLRLVKQMKPLELTIDEMRELLTVRDRLADPSTSSDSAPRCAPRRTRRRDHPVTLAGESRRRRACSPSMTNASSKSQAMTPPKGRPTSSQSPDNADSAWADRWITIQWTLVAVGAVGLVVLAFVLSRGSDTTPLHTR
jgi:DNA-binding transcriptional MerR regulator